jgi:spore coat protein A
LVLSPGERADVIVDFSQAAGKTFLLHNTSRDPGDGEIAMPGIMLFKVQAAVVGADRSQIPAQMQPIPRIAESEAKVSRRIVLGQSHDSAGDQMLSLNNKTWNDPVEENPKQGTTEVWELTNTLPDTHPFHMHLVQFQILDRTPFDVNQYFANGTVTLAGPAAPPDANEMGWKDTVKVTGNSVTRIIMRFLPYASYSVYHCHILEHEDMDMMRPFLITP